MSMLADAGVDVLVMDVTNAVRYWDEWAVVFPVMEKMGVYNFGYEDNGFMILPPMALITVGLIIWFQRSRNKSLIETK